MKIKIYHCQPYKIIFLPIIIFLSTISHANQCLVWQRNRSGITISVACSCSGEQLDSILENIVTHINRSDTNLKVYVIINGRNVHVCPHSNFFSVAYDTIRNIDVDYISNIYFAEDDKWRSEHPGANFFSGPNIPISLNSSTRDTCKQMGIKIIYNSGIYENINWNNLEKLISYAIANTEYIKQHQKIDTVEYWCNQWHVTLQTIDTFTIDSVLGIKVVRPQPIAKKQLSVSIAPWFAAGLIVMIMISYKIVRS